MKLVLCSEGFHTDGSVKACTDLVGKDQGQISVGIINEAYAVEQGDKRWVLRNFQSVANNFGGRIDIINLLALDIDEVYSRLIEVDVIFVIGGDTDYLMKVFIQTGFDKVLTKLLATKVYVGSSAGSMVAGRRISNAAYKLIYGGESHWGIDKYLGFVDFSIIPHLDSADFPNRKELFLHAAESYTDTAYGLKDDSVVVINGTDQHIVGSAPLIV